MYSKQAHIFTASLDSTIPVILARLPTVTIYLFVPKWKLYKSTSVYLIPWGFAAKAMNWVFFCFLKTKMEL